METIGKCRIPIYNFWEPSCKTIHVHLKYVNAIRDKKTDKKATKWIAHIFKHDMISGSFIPLAAIRKLQDLVCFHWKLAKFATGEKNCSQNYLTVSSIQLDDVFTKA